MLFRSFSRDFELRRKQPCERRTPISLAISSCAANNLANGAPRFRLRFRVAPQTPLRTAHPDFGCDFCTKTISTTGSGIEKVNTHTEDQKLPGARGKTTRAGLQRCRHTHRTRKRPRQSGAAAFKPITKQPRPPRRLCQNDLPPPGGGSRSKNC